MRSIVSALLVMCVAAAAFAQAPTPSHRQTPLQAAPCADNCDATIAASVIADNEFVQVLRLSIPPHARTPIHDVTARVVVWLSDAHFLDRYADGRVVDETRKRGEAEWVSPRRHAGENLSDQPMEFIAIVLKDAANGERPSPHAPGHR